MNVNIDRTRLRLCLMLVTWFLVSATPAHASDPAEGRSHYDMQCAICHGRDGSGMTSDIPNFRRGEGLWSSDSQLLLRIEGGKNGCPPFLGMLDRQGIFDVISYLRTFQ